MTALQIFRIDFHQQTHFMPDKYLHLQQWSLKTPPTETDYQEGRLWYQY